MIFMQLSGVQTAAGFEIAIKRMVRIASIPSFGKVLKIHLSLDSD